MSNREWAIWFVAAILEHGAIVADPSDEFKATVERDYPGTVAVLEKKLEEVSKCRS
jgi:hypothetical protein